MDLYQLLAKPMSQVPDRSAPVVAQAGSSPLHSPPSTQFTESVESTDEERGAALLGCMTP